MFYSLAQRDADGREVSILTHATHDVVRFMARKVRARGYEPVVVALSDGTRVFVA